ncbi:MAG: FAD-binding protein, partial [Clostridia bacterium]|nr:FAD-binding protein [Clostridia bacterium]
MSKAYDLIIIGSGSAGLTTAYECRQAGWSVAV